MDANSHSDDLKYLNKAITTFRVAVSCETAPAPEHFIAAKLWARHADSHQESALDTYLSWD